MVDYNAKLPGVCVNIQAKVSIHHLGSSVWSMKDVVSNEYGKTAQGWCDRKIGCPDCS